MSALLKSSVGLIYTIGADASDAENEVRKFTKAVEKETADAGRAGESAFGGLKDSISEIAGPAGIAAATMAAVAAITAKVALELFNLAKSVAEAASEISNFQKLTGLTVQSIGAIKIASESAGTSLEEFEEVWESFIEILIEGGKGADDAKEKLKLAGIDPQKGFKDLEGSVKKAFDAIRNAKTQAEKSAIAMAVFGESGLNMVKVADQMSGGFDQFKKKLVDAGMVMNEDGIRVSREFNKALKELNMQAGSVSTQFALGLMPSITTAMNEISGSLRGNKGVWREWGEEIGAIILRMVRGSRVALAALQDIASGNILPAVNTDRVLRENAAGYDQDRRDQETQNAVNDPNRPDFLKSQDKDIVALSSGGDYKPEDAEKAKKEATDAQDRLNKALADGDRQAFEQLQRTLIEQYKVRGLTAEKFNSEFLESETQFRIKMLDLIEKDSAQKRAAAKNATERKAIDTEERNAREKLIIESQQRENEAEKLITETQKEESEKRVKQSEKEADDRINRQKTLTDILLSNGEESFRKMLISEEHYIRTSQKLKLSKLTFELEELKGLEQTAEIKQRILEIDAQLIKEIGKNGEETVRRREDDKEWFEYYDKVLDREIEKSERKREIETRINDEIERRNELFKNVPASKPLEPGSTLAPEDQSFEFNFFDTFLEGVGRYLEGVALVETATGELEFSMGAVFDNIGNMALDAFSQIAQGFGSMVESWVLYGDTGGMTLRKLSAQILANLSAVATQYAIMCLAAAAFATTVFGAAILGGTPGQFLAAAALFGALAVGTALAGRALAGDSFKKESSTSGISSGVAKSEEEKRNGATAYSKYGDDVTTVENDRNKASESTTRVQIGLEKGLIAKIIREDVRDNGPIRQTLVEVQQGA